MKPAAIAAAAFLWIATARAEPVEVLSDGNVTVTFEKTGDAGQIDEFKKNILPEVKKILEELSTELGGKSKGAKVSSYSVDTFAAKFPHTTDKRIPAFYDGTGVHARADNELSPNLRVTLRHELTHLILGKTYDHIPAWLNEGLAMYEERKVTIDPIPNYIDYNTIHIAKQDGKYIPIEQLDSSGIFGRSHGTVTAGLAYYTAYVAVYELKEKSGMEAIRQYLKALSQPAADRNRAFQTNFGMTIENFNTYLIEKAAKKS